jgi:hypothetical protein
MSDYRDKDLLSHVTEHIEFVVDTREFTCMETTRGLTLTASDLLALSLYIVFYQHERGCTMV